MTVTVITVKLYAPWVHSLKEKRAFVKSLCEKVRNRFRVSIIESDAQDVHQTAIISIAFLSMSSDISSRMGETIHSFIERSTDAEIVDIWVEQR